MLCHIDEALFKDWSQSTTDIGVLKLSTALKPMLCSIVLIWANTYNASLKFITFIKRWFLGYSKNNVWNFLKCKLFHQFCRSQWQADRFCVFLADLIATPLYKIIRYETHVRTHVPRIPNPIIPG